MKALSQSEYGVIRSLYQDVYSSDVAESILDEFTDEDLDDLTDEYIEEQVTEFFEECLEEGLDIDIVEQTICESVDTELEILTEVTNPAQVAAMRMRDKTSAASGEGQKAGRDAGSMARAKLKVSKEKIGSASPEKKASKLSQIKGIVKKVGSAAKTGLKTAGKVAVKSAEVAGKAAGNTKNLVKDIGSAAKKGYKSTQSSSPSTSSSSSDSGTSSSSSDSDTPSTSSTGPSSSSSSSGGGESSAAPRNRKDGLLKRGLKKVVRGISKGVSAAAGAVKAGADSITNRARKEEMNYNKELATIKELYSQVCNNQSEEEIEEDMKPLPKEKMERQSNKAYAKEVVAARQGNEKETNKQMQRRIAMTDPAGRKAALRKEELYKGKHGQTEKQYQDSRSDAGKMVSGDSKGSGANYSYRAKNTGSNPAGGSEKPQGQSRMGKKDRDYLAYRKANLKKEELEATGLFTMKEIEAIVESENVDEAMSSYDKNRKRAAQRAADRNAARAAGKTGAVPGVGYVTPNKERETYTDEKGTVRHKSGAKNE